MVNCFQTSALILGVTGHFRYFKLLKLILKNKPVNYCTLMEVIPGLLWYLLAP